MSAIRTETTIYAPADLVWAILTDFRTYGRWNPYIRAIQGRAQVGTPVQITTQHPGRDSVTRRHILLKVDSPRELRWRGRLALPGLIGAVYGVRLDPQPGGGTRLRQSATSHGLLGPLLRGASAADLRRSLESMNAALKNRAEKVYRDAQAPRTTAQQEELLERTTRLNNALSWSG